MFLYPLFSAVLLILSFKHFGLWFLSWIALVPYFYFLNSGKDFPLKKIFLSGFILGSVLAFGVYFPVISAHFLMWFLVVLICGFSIGLIGIIYTKLKQNNLWDIFIFAALWVVFEWLRQLIFQNFDYTTLAYTAYGLIPLLSFAGIGGIYLVSLIIAVINGFVGWFWLNGPNQKLKIVFGIFALAVISIYSLNQLYLNSGDKSGHKVSFSIIQLEEDSTPYGKFENGKFIISERVKDLIREAGQGKSDYVVYPYSLVKNVIIPRDSGFKEPYINGAFEDINEWLKNIIPADKTFIMWPDTMREKGKIFDETDFWKDGKIIGFYQKRTLYPLYGIAGGYFRKTGIFTRPYDYTLSKENKIINIGGERFSNLSCSELNHSFLARRDSLLNANIILSLGYNSIFENPILGEGDLVVAQLRAAETNLPLIRNDIRGPSAFIDKKGKIILRMEANQAGILNGELSVEDSPRRTVYTYLGDYPLIILLFISLLSFGIVSKKRNLI